MATNEQIEGALRGIAAAIPTWFCYVVLMSGCGLGVWLMFRAFQ